MILHSHSNLRARVFAEVEKERLRQDALVAARILPFNCATPEITPGLKLAVLGEEFGEVATAIYESCISFVRSEESKSDLRAELVQLAACAVAWLESLDAQSGK